MKLMFASDIHGDIDSARKIIEIYKNEGAERLILLGDLLYHGPRNDLPESYAPKEVIALLNGHRDEIAAVRGNCEAEVDQMVLSFPVMADYMLLFSGGVSMFITHGHKFNTDNPPALKKGDILIHGHTHIPAVIPFGDENVYINPGSAALPKENTPKSYMIFEDGTFSIRTLDGEEFMRHEV